MNNGWAQGRLLQLLQLRLQLVQLLLLLRWHWLAVAQLWQIFAAGAGQ